MNLSDLWIGDLLRIKSTGKVGSYEGSIGSDIALLKIRGVKVEVLASELKIYKEPKEEKPALKKVYKTNPIIIKSLPNEIDLHLEKLTDNHAQIIPDVKLDFQINACISYIQNAIEQRKHKVLIIHGKGNGTLKAEVINLVQDFSQITKTIELNNGGAMEVWFSY